MRVSTSIIYCEGSGTHIDTLPMRTLEYLALMCIQLLFVLLKVDQASVVHPHHTGLLL